jgi:hypothetical protein
MTDEAQQHLGWLKQYVGLMSEDNWRDMKLRCERQLEELSAALSAACPEGQMLREALRDHRCLSDGAMLVGECVDSGRCGCTNGLLLAASPSSIPSPTGEGAAGEERCPICRGVQHPAVPCPADHAGKKRDKPVDIIPMVGENEVLELYGPWFPNGTGRASPAAGEVEREWDRYRRREELDPLKDNLSDLLKAFRAGAALRTAPSPETEKAKEARSPLHCHAGRDGDCWWPHCPQCLPDSRQSHCPLACLTEAYRDDEGFWKSPAHEAAFRALTSPAEREGERLPGQRPGESREGYLRERGLQHIAFMGGEGDEVLD